MSTLPPAGRLLTLTKRLLTALDKAHIRPSLDLGHVELMQAACMFEGRLTREQFVELAGGWWDRAAAVESPVPKPLRTPVPDHAPLPLELLEEKARDIGRLIGTGMPAGAGFLVVLFDYAPNGHMTYVTSAQRPGAVAMLKELLGKLQGGTN
jgi:hypothetical protein